MEKNQPESPPRYPHSSAAVAQSSLAPGVLLAFFAIYFVWGSTYLSIRVLVETVPPLLAAGLRFTIAGMVLFLWSKAKGISSPSQVEWRNLCVLGALMFLISYGGLFWAEKTIPSGIASVLVATIPVWVALFEIFVFKKEKLRLALIVAICLGMSGVITLSSGSGAEEVKLLPCLAILGAEIAWSYGTVLSKRMTLPVSKLMSAAAQMMIGGLMLLVCSALLGELHSVAHFTFKATACLIYLIVAGSVLGFTAYIWLLARMPATKVASYAYVNPVIALAIGHWLGGEVVTLKTFSGAALVLVSVALLLLNFGRK